MLLFGNPKNEQANYEKIINKYTILSNKALNLHKVARSSKDIKRLEDCLSYWRKCLNLLNKKNFSKCNLQDNIDYEKKFCVERINQVFHDILIYRESQKSMANIENQIVHYVIEKNVLSYIKENDCVFENDIYFYISKLMENKTTAGEIEKWLNDAEEKGIIAKKAKDNKYKYFIPESHSL